MMVLADFIGTFCGLGIQAGTARTGANIDDLAAFLQGNRRSCAWITDQ
jgi:hypothetical protein